MRVLIDTNVLLDFLMGRKPFFDVADQIIKLCVERKMEGYMAAHSVLNIYYVLRKSMSDVERREVLQRSFWDRDLLWKKLVWDDSLIAAVVKIEKDFWDRYVRNGRMWI